MLRPGGVAKVFSGTRTKHRLEAAMEAVGFVLNNDAAWMQGQGFPKSLDLAKTIDAHLGVTPEVVGVKDGVQVAPEDRQGFGGIVRGGVGIKQTHALVPVTRGGTPQARLFQGWGTALKPSWEPFVLGRKPVKEM